MSCQSPKVSASAVTRSWLAAAACAAATAAAASAAADGGGGEEEAVYGWLNGVLLAVENGSRSQEQQHLRRYSLILSFGLVLELAADVFRTP